MDREQTKTYLKVFLNLGIMLVIILLFIFVVPKVIIYFMPFVAGWIIALIASPMVKFFEKKLKIKRKAGSAVVIVAVIALVILGGYFIGVKITEQVINFMEELPALWKSMEKDFSAIGTKMNVAYHYLPLEVKNTIDNILENFQEYLSGAAATFSVPTIEALGSFAKSLPNIVIGIIMSLLFSYFYVADKEYIPNLLEKAMPKAVTERFNMIKRGLRRAIGGYFKAQFKIEVWMYVLLVIGLSILKVRYAFIIAIGIAFLDLLPFFGTGTVLLPWAIIKFLNADYTTVIGLLLIWGVGQLARQIIQPKIVGDSVGLSPIPTIFLLYIGYKTAGVIGMIIAVPIGIIVLNMYEEGVFDTTLNSLKVLYASVSNFRHLTKEDMAVVDRYKEEEEKRMQRKRGNSENESNRI